MYCLRWLQYLPFCAGTLLLMYAAAVPAEYRAFELGIRDGTGQVIRSISSVLDDQQYTGYYPLAPGQSIVIISSWMCRGNTAHFTPICANPQLAAEPQTPPDPTVPPSPAPQP